MSFGRATIAHLDWNLLVEGLLVRVRCLGLGYGLLLLLLLRILGMSGRFDFRSVLRSSWVHRGRVGAVLLEAGLLREWVRPRRREVADRRLEWPIHRLLRIKIDGGHRLVGPTRGW